MAATVKGLIIKIVGDVGGLTGALASVQKASNKLSNDLGKIGKELTTKVTVPIVAGFAAAVKETASFEKGLAKVRAVSKATDDEFAMLSGRAREMARTTLHSTTDVADAMYYMGLAGWNAQEIYEGLPAVLDLATAADEDLATVSDIVTDALTAFGMEANDTAHFVDVLAEASRSSNTTVAMMGEAFKYAAPLAGNMGYSVDDVAVALGLMANNGIKASMAGTALRALFQRMATQPKQASDAMDQLDLSLLRTDGSAKTMMELMESLRDAFGGLTEPSEEIQKQMDELADALDNNEISAEEYEEQLGKLADAAYGVGSAEKMRLAAMLAGARGMPGLLAIVNATEEEFSELAGAITDADGATRQMSLLMEQTTFGQFKLLLSQLQELAVQFGTLILPYVQQFIGYLSNLVKKFSEMDDSQKEAIIRIAALAAVIGPLLMVLSGLAAAVTFLMNPIGLLIAVIGAAAAAFVYLWTTSKEFREELTYQVKNAIYTVQDFFKDMGETMKRRWDNIKTDATNAWNDIVNAIKNPIVGLYTLMMNRFNNMVDGLRTKLNIMKDIAQAAINAISRIFGTAKIQLPKIKLPHFSVTKGKTIMGVSLPKISVSWYRKAYDNPYLFTSPTIVGNRGFGDGGGSGELVYGRDQLMRDIAAASQGEITINVYASDGMDVNQLAVKVQNRLAQLQKQRVSVYA